MVSEAASSGRLVDVSSTGRLDPAGEAGEGLKWFESGPGGSPARQWSRLWAAGCRMLAWGRMAERARGATGYSKAEHCLAGGPAVGDLRLAD
jgi:hypothetical protein